MKRPARCGALLRRIQASSSKRQSMSVKQDTSASAIIPPVQLANSFSLSGHGIHVDFSSTSLNGQPRLTYHDTVQTRSFSGDEIRTNEVPDLGTIVSVTLSITPDVGSTTFSLLIPTVFVLGMGSLTPVTTDAVTTVHRTPFVVRFVGQRELYRVTRMTGTASAVVF
jgi:hypothetical protein